MWVVERRCGVDDDRSRHFYFASVGLTAPSGAQAIYKWGEPFGWRGDVDSEVTKPPLAPSNRRRPGGGRYLSQTVQRDGILRRLRLHGAFEAQGRLPWHVRRRLRPAIAARARLSSERQPHSTTHDQRDHVLPKSSSIVNLCFADTAVVHYYAVALISIQL